MLTALILSTLAILPRDLTVRESVDLIEKNRFFDDNCNPVFCQIIFYDWQHGVHVVVAWRLVKEGMTIQENPPVVTWNDEGRMRQVKSACWRESWTQFDPELAERERLPKERRRGLIGEKR